MARLPALVEAIAGEDDRDLSTLNLIARNVREAGHITTTKRGVGAAGMTVRDAANLLIGLYGADSPKEAPNAVPIFRTLRPEEPPRRKKASFPKKGGLIEAIDSAECFGEALETLISGVPEMARMLLAYVQDAYSHVSPELQRKLASGVLRCAGVDVSFFHLTPFAIIEIWHRTPEAHCMDRRWAFRADPELLMQGFYARRRGNRRVQVTFQFDVLELIHNVLSKDATNAPGQGMERGDAPPPSTDAHPTPRAPRRRPLPKKD